MPRNAPNWHAVSLLNQKLYDRFQSTHALGQVRDAINYTETTAKSVELIAGKYGMTVPRDLQGNAVANLAFRTKIGAYPPPHHRRTPCSPSAAPAASSDRTTPAGYPPHYPASTTSIPSTTPPQWAGYLSRWPAPDHPATNAPTWCTRC
jgi:hypothetical protein